MNHQPDEILKTSGLKVTEQRKIILQFLLDHHGPFTVEEMAQQMHKENFDLATLYRSMSTFEEVGLVEKRLFGDGLVRWEYRSHGACEHHHHGHHHHLMCQICKNIITLDICLPQDLFQVVEKYDFKDLKHHLEFSGICPQCQKTKELK
jgi:Fur family transcriptional regulator, ferric uptake regulator